MPVADGMGHLLAEPCLAVVHLLSFQTCEAAACIFECVYLVPTRPLAVWLCHSQAFSPRLVGLMVMGLMEITTSYPGPVLHGRPAVCTGWKRT